MESELRLKTAEIQRKNDQIDDLKATLDNLKQRAQVRQDRQLAQIIDDKLNEVKSSTTEDNAVSSTNVAGPSRHSTDNALRNETQVNEFCVVVLLEIREGVQFCLLIFIYTFCLLR